MNLTYKGRMDLSLTAREQFQLAPLSKQDTPTLIPPRIRVWKIGVTENEVTFTGPALGFMHRRTLHYPISAFDQVVYSPFAVAAREKLKAAGIPDQTIDTINRCIDKLRQMSNSAQLHSYTG